MLNVDYFSRKMCEAAFMPELWVPLLDELAVETGSSVGGIGVYWPRTRGIRTSFEIAPGHDEWEQTLESQEHWTNYVRGSGILNKGFVQVDPFEGDWSGISDFDARMSRYIKSGYGVQLGTMIELFNGEIISLEFSRRYGEPRYSLEQVAGLNTLHPAFSHSAFFASRLQFERVRGGIEMLKDVGLAAAFIGSNRKLLLKNVLFDEYDEYFSNDRSGQISIRGNDALRKRFNRAMEISLKRGVSVPVPADAFRKAAVIQLIPLFGNAQTIFAMAGAVMMITPVATTIGLPSAEVVSGIFNLTPAEARLAITLTAGLSLRDTAANQGITFGTARAYLNSVFSKTGTNQQSTLVSLLKSIPPAI